MATTTKNIRGTGDLLPRLKNFLEYRSIPYRQLHIAGSHIGYTNDRAVFIAKKQIWREQVSTQKYIVQRSIERQKWIIFWIPNKWLLKFDPKVIWENGWQNKRWEEFMLNIHTKFGTCISPDELKSLKNLEYDIEAQLELAQFA